METVEIKTITIKSIKDTSNRFAAMLDVPGTKHKKKLDVQILNTLSEISAFVRTWQMEAIRNHCDFFVDPDVPYSTLIIGIQVAGSSDTLPTEVCESTPQPVFS